jgi:hypothetical protein
MSPLEQSLVAIALAAAQLIQEGAFTTGGREEPP